MLVGLFFLLVPHKEFLRVTNPYATKRTRTHPFFFLTCTGKSFAVDLIASTHYLAFSRANGINVSNDFLQFLTQNHHVHGDEVECSLSVSTDCYLQN
jgi:hypothetical protein